MSDELVLATSSDTQESAEKALNPDREAGRVKVEDSALSDFTAESTDGKTITSYERADSSRHLYEQQLDEAEADLVELSKPEPAEADATAQQSDIDIEAVRKAATEDAIRDARARMTAQQQSPSVESQYNAVLEQAGAAFVSRMEEIKSKDPSFMQLVHKLDDVIFAPEVREAMVYSGADVVAYLVRNPGEAKKLAALPPLAAVAQVGALATKMTTNSRRVQPAPGAVITPVGGSSTKSAVPLDEAPYQDYRRIRDQQEKNRYRR
jgi:hypothetical protein